MSKTISVKLPDDDAEILEKISADRQESVSEFVRNLIRSAGEKGDNLESGKEKNLPAKDPRFDEILTLLWKLLESKCDPNQSQNSDDETAKKIEEVIKLISGIPSILSPQIQKILDEIGQNSKSGGDQDGVGIEPETIKTLAEDIKKNTEKLDSLKTAPGRSVSFKNPEFWKKSLAVVGIWSIIIVGVQGWGNWKIYQRGTANAETAGMAEASPVYESFNHLIMCDEPGWSWSSSKDGKKVYCHIRPNPLTGKPYELRIR